MKISVWWPNWLNGWIVHMGSSCCSKINQFQVTFAKQSSPLNHTPECTKKCSRCVSAIICVCLKFYSWTFIFFSTSRNKITHMIFAGNKTDHVLNKSDSVWASFLFLWVDLNKHHYQVFFFSEQSVLFSQHPAEKQTHTMVGGSSVLFSGSTLESTKWFHHSIRNFLSATSQTSRYWGIMFKLLIPFYNLLSKYFMFVKKGELARNNEHITVW